MPSTYEVVDTRVSMLLEHVNSADVKEQGRIHGHQLRTGRQGRKCASSLVLTNGPTNGRTDGRMDKASYRVACPRLKKKASKNEGYRESREDR